MKITVISTIKELVESDLQRHWSSLYEKCQWATVLQSWEFVFVWYESYKRSFAPVVVVGRDETGNVAGILPLAISIDTAQLVVAGSYQAEYQAWLATASAGDVFIESALQVVSERFPNRALQFLFLPPGAPTHWTIAGKWSGRCELRPLPRALMRIGDGSSFVHSLRKKGNKSRINRLERLGEVRFEQVTERSGLAAIFDEVITYATFRVGAIQSEPVGRDPFKKDFYLAMMDVPRLIHATVLRVGNHVASAHIGLYNRDSVLLGVLAHSPFLAQHSPGKLHVLMLGVELAKQDIPIFDLTPGGEYKERFATHHD